MTDLLDKNKPFLSTKYAYLVGRIRMLERGILTTTILENAIKAEDLEQSLRIISEQSYLSEVFQNITKNPPALDNALLQHWWQTLNDISQNKLGLEISTFFRMSLDFNDIKLILKRHLSKEMGGKEYPSTFEWKKVNRYISGETGEYLSEVYKKAIDEALAVYESTHQVQSIEIVLDRIFLNETLKYALICESKVIKNWLMAYVILSLLRAAFRARYQKTKIEYFKIIYLDNPYLNYEDLRQIITEPEDKVTEIIKNLGYASIILPNEEFKSDPIYLSEIEKEMDNYLMRVIRSYRMQAFGPEPVFGFLYAKMTDIRNLRIILHGKYFQINENEIKSKLRECYYE